MPFTPHGAERLAAELEHADEVHHPPRLVWLFDRDTFGERRAALYGRRSGDPPRVLVVWHEPGAVDVVAWVCEPYVRTRHE